MSRENPSQAGVPSTQESLGDQHVPGRLRDLLGARLEREVYLSTEEAAQLAGRPSREAFIKWARKVQIPLRRAPGSREYRVRRSDIDWALRVR